MMIRNGLRAAVLAIALVGMGASFGGCSYGGIAVVKDSHVIITKNDGILFGLMRQVFVCKVTAAGVTGCASKDNP